jgi:hypothetical protein
MEVLGVLKKIGAEKKFPLFFKTQSVIISKIPGDNGVVKSFPRNKTFELMPGVQLLKE